MQHKKVVKWVGVEVDASLSAGMLSKQTTAVQDEGSITRKREVKRNSHTRAREEEEEKGNGLVIDEALGG